ncbi:MAG: COQ9 family protein [Rhodospirillaceae bacterium]|nr:COQ9 family protein [Rhodospirillaceae bacterium]
MERKEEEYLKYFDKIEIDVLYKLIGHTPFTGWSANSLNLCLEENGNLDSIEELFPNGIDDLTDLYIKVADKKLEYDLRAVDLNSKSIRERIKILLNLRLDFFAKEKQVITQIIGKDLLLGPRSSLVNRIGSSVDLMWRLAGDRSLDYNFYTKRILLSGVYISTILFWLEVDNRDDVSNFIDRRISNVMQIEKIKKSLNSIFVKKKFNFPLKSFF